MFLSHLHLLGQEMEPLSPRAFFPKNENAYSTASHLLRDPKIIKWEKMASSAYEISY